MLNIAGSWEQPDDDAANIEWAREAWNDMKAFSTGGTYINFLTEDEGPERIEAALGNGPPAAGRGQGEVGSAERVPHEPEHQTGLRAPIIA